MKTYISVRYNGIDNMVDTFNPYVNKNKITRCRDTGYFYYEWIGSQEQLSAFILNNSENVFDVQTIE